MWSIVRQVLTQAWDQFVGQCLGVLPNVLAGLLFLAMGVIVAVLAGWVARALLRRANVDGRANRLGVAGWLERLGILSATVMVVRGIQGLIGILTAVLILYALDAVLAAELVKQFFLYLPHLIVAVVILVLGIFAAGFVARSVLIGAVNLGVAPARPLAVVVRAGIVLMAVAVALETLGIGSYTMPASFLILLAGVTLAGALAVGLGSADLVKRWHEERRSHPPDDDDTGGISHW